MEEKAYPIKFICDHDCENCLIDDLACLYDIKHADNLHSCRNIMHSWFEGDIITKERYDEISKAVKETKDFFDDYEKFNCPSTRKCNLCKSCEVYDYLTSIGYEAAGLTNDKFRNFKISYDKWTDKRCNTCKELMQKLCGVEVYRRSFVEIPEINYESILGFEDYLASVIQHARDIRDNKCTPGDVIPKDGIRPYKKKITITNMPNRNRPSSKPSYFHYHAPYEKAELSESEKPKEWIPPFKYIGDARALSKYAKECVSLRDDIYLFFGEFDGSKFIEKNNIKSLPISEGRKLFKESVKTELKKDNEQALRNPWANNPENKQACYDKYKNCLFDLNSNSYYFGILDAPVCCGDCRNCVIYHNIYKPKGIAKSKSIMRSQCHKYAEKYTDEISNIFGYIKVERYISLDNIYRLMNVQFSFSIKRALRRIIAETKLKERNAL